MIIRNELHTLWYYNRSPELDQTSAKIKIYLLMAYLGTDLIPALSNLNMNYVPHDKPILGVC